MMRRKIFLLAAPEPNRDLFLGMGGTRLAPDPTAPYKVIEVKRAGFSMGLTVEGPGQRKWSAKMPPEASTEVVASRLLWGVGYHQPPIYYVGRWNADGAPEPNPQLPARFRESKPDLHGLDSEERLTDRQWQDAFRAGGYAPAIANRFIRRFKQKIEEGLALGR